MKSDSRLLVIKNQFKQFRLPFLIFLLFWILGIVLLFIFEPNKNFWNILLISVCVFADESNRVIFTVYQFLWPLLFELLILSFILSTLQDIYGFNPIMSSRKLAASRKHHTVVLGYNHLGERIVEFLRENKRPYSVVEIDYEKMDDLISLGEPVVVGDYTDIDIMRLAGIKRCKEVFCVTRDIRRALIAAERVRELNKYCDLYMRVFDEHFRSYLSKEPWNAFTFSLSKWNMESAKEWSKNIKKGDMVIVLGNDTVVHRIVEYLGTDLGINVHLIDSDIDSDVYNDLDNVTPHQDQIKFLENLEEKCNLEHIKQIYICWNTKELFSDAILLTVAIKENYPNIELFVRMFDEELADIAKALGVTTFSTSAYAFECLQSEVRFYSGIYPVPEKKKRKLFSRKKSI